MQKLSTNTKNRPKTSDNEANQSKMSTAASTKKEEKGAPAAAAVPEKTVLELLEEDDEFEVRDFSV